MVLNFGRRRRYDDRRWWLEARQLAELAEDPEVRVIAMLSMSLHATTGNSPADSRKAIDVQLPDFTDRVDPTQTPTTTHQPAVGDAGRADAPPQRKRAA